MILTPERIEDLLSGRAASCPTKHLMDTLAAYAEIVQGMAEAEPFIEELVGDGERDWICWFCGGLVDIGNVIGQKRQAEWKAEHAPDCLYLAARKLRGLE